MPTLCPLCGTALHPPRPRLLTVEEKRALSTWRKREWRARGSERLESDGPIIDAADFEGCA
jgi:hypothetical protein